jgi:hypothetical protein
MITPPLDKIPKMPGQLMQMVVKQVNVQLDKAFAKLDTLLDEVAILPDNCKCDDPRISDIEEKLNEVLEVVNKLKDEVLPVVQDIITAVNGLVKGATAIKAAIFLIPIVGVAALQAELMMVQNATIVNAIKSVDQLNILPSILSQGVGIMSSKLAIVINSLSNICTDKEFEVIDEIKQSIDATTDDNTPGTGKNAGGGGDGNWRLVDGNGSGGSPLGQPPMQRSPHTDACGSTWVWQGILDPGTGIAWGSDQSRINDATMGTEFYNELNVSQDDLNSYLDNINKIVTDQADLLTSLQEAPAQSYEGVGYPAASLGKLGDYYIDKTNKVVYGPRTITGWDMGVNY